VQIILDDVLSVSINGRGAFSASISDRMMGFGPIALYAGGAAEVRFKEVSYKDLNHKTEPKEIVSKNFQMQRLSDLYYGWCAAVADINRDGVMDVIAGPFYYLAGCGKTPVFGETLRKRATPPKRGLAESIAYR
jgi:hypothetical protein